MIIDRIHEFNRFGMVLGLDRMEELLRRLGNPQDDLKVIHVAGTNGKGSVSKYLEEGLSACGYKMGLYTSPYIETFNERIRYDGADISDEDLEYYGQKVVSAAEAMVADGLDSPTEFEVVTAIAFLYFAGRQADITILEVGGGIRDEKRICQYLDLGVGRVILGTIAVKEPEFLKEMVGKYGEKIAVGVDARDGYVAINGWKEITAQESFSFCKDLRDMGVKTVIYTDISRDGGLEGTNMDAYRKLQQIEGLEVTASGGISFEREITELKDIVAAAILGKAIYSGALDLSRAVELAR